MSDTTPLRLPEDLPYPITITRISVDKGTNVRRGDRMLEYSFMSATRRKELDKMAKEGKEPPSRIRGNDMVGSWESPIDGEVKRWDSSVKPGAIFERRNASKPVVRIEQPCTHPVQFNGMCGVCGADLTNDDYLSRPNNEAGPSRYPGSFEMAHDSSGVTVSATEAKRLETQTRDELLKEKKLSLIVDLDQTIIHTTVDPTVGEWLDECAEDAKAEAKAKEEEEARSEELDGTNVKEGDNDGAGTDCTAKEDGGDGDVDMAMKDDSGGQTGASTTPPTSPKPKRQPNPNAAALKDVARFQLAEDLPPGKVRGKGQQPSRWYYTKPRPGLTEFLADMSKMYEMHVYTMGTRTYADAICKIIDPDGKIFGGRILSRDESGSMSSKSLVRLFPTDQSMVVIIDDRADVWADSPNLVKVIPYDFFVGIGDINGSFLPPQQSTMTMPVKSQTSGSESSAASTPQPTTPSDIPSTEDGLIRQSKLLDEMTAARPLAKLERENEENDEDTDSEEADSEPSKGKESPKSDVSAEDGKGPDDDNDKAAPHVVHLRHQHNRKAVLNDEDSELERVGGILHVIHSQYYQAYDRRDPTSDTLPMLCDTTLIIQELKDQVLQGCVIGFTGVIPIHTAPEQSETWKSAESFGAQCVKDLTPSMTHLVTANLQTKKMHDAGRMPGLKIVWLAWLQSCIALWKRESEAPFLVSHPAWERERKADEHAPSLAKEEKEVEAEEDQDSDEEFRRGALMWDEAADAEFEEFLNATDDEDLDEDNAIDAEGGAKSPVSVIDNDERHTWLRESTPSRSILSRAPSPSPGRETPKAVAWADDENQPLERIREPQPGEIVSYPPRKKRKILMLTAPSDDDEVPEANKLEFSGKMDWSNGESSKTEESPRSGSDHVTDTDDEDSSASMARLAIA
ncbi:hypothetical protein CspeluHIS016_0101760 [Cutaneotrichosporon spelunceum]|uniref:RNA polymerase II subunit A C-terminal domain phosphatase n=1 Tax=Cutaneotrichosporon spelunceum TaxID=1672016 RepID=A0AAD3TNM2_9TREE|nr:hypothetical protein CspeluHIS016_0101760 [Cutaneotrichosporon spelunceum]